jgi:hypothetical protein
MTRFHVIQSDIDMKQSLQVTNFASITPYLYNTFLPIVGILFQEYRKKSRFPRSLYQTVLN